ncbi:RNA polymerase factor sigma-32 [Candidatus Kaiserbacteria bacterium]|nr:RNA polymerase factor sigma-32 [Candidatus Kaiserbacteria bacterium]
MKRPIELAGSFVTQAYQFPILSRERELQLAIQWRDHEDLKALQEIVQCHLKLVIAMAAKYSGYGTPLSDLVQEGNVGLMNAAARFKPELKFRFSTYAQWWIRASMTDYILRTASVVKIGTTQTQKKLFFGLRKAKSRIRAYGEGDMSVEQVEKISRMMGVSKSDIIQMNQRLMADLSLNAPASIDDDSAATFIDILVEPSPSIEEVLEQRQTDDNRLKALRGSLGILGPRERRILEARRLHEEPLTLEQLGNEFGVSRERIRQIEVRAYKKLAAAVRNKFDKLSKPVLHALEMSVA